jgi:hypothetical protein
MFKDGKEILYLYTMRNGKIFVHEGTVELYTPTRRRVRFSDGSGSRCYPKHIGVLDTTGPNVWLETRDDVLVRNKFIEYQEQQLDDLWKQIERKSKIIKKLKEGA